MYLIIGTGLLAVGIGIAAFATFSIAKEVLQNGSFLKDKAILPGSTAALVMKNVTTGQSILMAISGQPADTLLVAEIQLPNGTVASTYHFNKTPFTTAFRSIASGDYTLVIKNAGNESVTTNAALIFVPLGQEGQIYPGTPGNFTGPLPPGKSFSASQIQNFVTYGVTILLGIVLIIAGIVMLIIGAIKFFKERKKEGEPRSQTNS